MMARDARVCFCAARSDGEVEERKVSSLWRRVAESGSRPFCVMPAGLSLELSCLAVGRGKWEVEAGVRARGDATEVRGRV